MKKGLLLTLVVTVAMLSSLGFAYAPVMQNVPDIIIGDIEEGDANNFFVFSDAFTFDDYVNDQDSTVSELMWSFKKTQGTQEILINDLGEETTDVTFLNPTNDIRDGFDMASFRNETLSPSSGSTPYPDPATIEDIYLALYVSDGTFKDSEEIVVYTADGGEDGYSGLGVNPFLEETFDVQGGWSCYFGSGAAAATYGSWQAGQLNAKWPSISGWPTPGWWAWYESAGGGGLNYSVTYTADTVYAMKMSLSANKDIDVPSIRARIGDSGFAWTAMSNFGFWPGAAGNPTTTADDFLMLWQPQGSTTDAFIAFDGWAGGNTGEVYVLESKVYKIPVAQISTQSTQATISNFSSWGSTANTAVTIGTTVTFGDISSPTWHNVGSYVTLTDACAAGDVYRVKYALAKASGTTYCDQTRLRVNDAANGAFDSEFVFDDGFATSKNLAASAQDYILYHSVVNGRSGSNDLAVWCDGIPADRKSVV